MKPERTALALTAILLSGPTAFAKTEMSMSLVKQCYSKHNDSACREISKIDAASANPQVRLLAVGMPQTEQTVLANMAMTDTDISVRRSAFKKVTDQALLAKIALEASDSDIRNMAAAKSVEKSEMEKISEEKSMAADVQSTVMTYLTKTAYKSSDWHFSEEDTKIIQLDVDTGDNHAMVTAQVVFTGGTGQGVRMSNGSQMIFGDTIGSSPDLGLNMYGVRLYRSPPSSYGGRRTYLMVTRTFVLYLIGGSWKITYQFGLSDPADAPVSPL